MRIVNFLIFLFLVLLLVLAAILILTVPKEYGYQLYGFIVIALVWVFVLVYQKTSFYPHNIKSLPKNRWYHIFEKQRKSGKFIFTLVEMNKYGLTNKKRTLVHNENIHEPYFRINNNRELETVPIR